MYICVCAVYACVGMYTWVCMCILVYVCMYVGVYICECYVCVLISSLSLSVYMVAWYNVTDPFVRSEQVTGDPDPIQVCASYGPGILAIRRLIHEMIQRFIPVCIVNTRR